MHDDSSAPRYCRKEIVEAVTNFYTFLTHLHVPHWKVCIPPPGGWPNITRESHALLKKTDEVIELMRYLPYIYDDDHSNALQVYPESACVDYHGPLIRRAFRWAREHDQDLDVIDIEPDEEFTQSQTPPDVLCLASRTCRDGPFILLDTTEGTITIFEWMDGPKGGGTVKDLVLLVPSPCPSTRTREEPNPRANPRHSDVFAA